MKRTKMFSNILKKIDKEKKVQTERELLLISHCFGLTFDTVMRYVEREIKNKYTKKKIIINKKDSKNRLQSVIS